MIDQSKELFAAEIIGYCMKKPRTVNEIVKKIYKYDVIDARKQHTVGRTYTVLEKLVRHGVMIVKCNDREIKFQVNGGYFEK